MRRPGTFLRHSEALGQHLYVLALQASPPRIQFGLGDSESDVSRSQYLARATDTGRDLASRCLAGNFGLYMADQQE